MHRSRPGITPLIALTALLLCGGITASAETPIETIKQLEHAFSDAILDQDKASLDRLLADDYQTGDIRALTTPEQIEQISTALPPKSRTDAEMCTDVASSTSGSENSRM